MVGQKYFKEGTNACLRGKNILNINKINNNSENFSGQNYI